MHTFLIQLSKSLIFWLTWIIIPLVMEIIPAVGSFLVLIKKYIQLQKKTKPVAKYPEITIIVPVYNSESTLRNCITSIAESTYPNEMIDVYLVNNKSKDQSAKVFELCQKLYPTLSMQWMEARQGKAKALNMALFSAKGKYIIHIDSDGVLEKDALKNMVEKFESNLDITCMTGTILTNPKDIEKTKGFLWRLFRRCEFYEYANAFLAGRNYESETDSVFTLSGAFSAFRKSTILKTELYNTDTVCEDTQVTFQVRTKLKERVLLCENAIFMVDPIETLNKLYTQRQRWQRGELEVLHMFMDKRVSVVKGFLSNFAVRLLIFDHTFAFPRMIWYFALIFLSFTGYSVKLILGSLGIIYGLYIFSGFLYFISCSLYLKAFPKYQAYYLKHWYLIILMPFYNFFIFWIRFAGIINSINTGGQWRSKDYTEEKKSFFDIIKLDFSFLNIIVQAIRKNYHKNHETLASKKK